MKKILALIISFAFGASAIGSAFTTREIDTWYATLAQSSLTPPNAAFGIVWTILYALMAIAAWLVYLEAGKPGRTSALIAYGVQLVLNVVWSIVFFGMHELFGGLIVIGLLWIGILVTMLRFYRVRPLAGLLFIPYLVWVSFASYLNFYIYLNN